jgi:hypothetical protein
MQNTGTMHLIEFLKKTLVIKIVNVMKKIILIGMLMFFSFNLFSQTISNQSLEKRFIEIRNKLNKEIGYPKLEISDDYFYQDLDGDGENDYVLMTQTNDKYINIKDNDLVYREKLIVYISSLKKYFYFNKLLPCFNCGNTTLNTSNRNLKRAKSNEFIIGFDKRESNLIINNFFTFGYDKLNNKFYMIERVRMYYDEELCSEIRQSKRLFMEKVDLMNDLFSSSNWYFNRQIQRCSIWVNVKLPKIIINNNLGNPTKMYLLKNDPVEVIEEKDNWLKIKYYPEKNGEWTGKTIEGWIKKSDVE